MCLIYLYLSEMVVLLEVSTIFACDNCIFMTLVLVNSIKVLPL